jgi:hypothetical protein
MYILGSSPLTHTYPGPLNVGDSCRLNTRVAPSRAALRPSPPTNPRSPQIPRTLLAATPDAGGSGGTIPSNDYGKERCTLSVLQWVGWGAGWRYGAKRLSPLVPKRSPRECMVCRRPVWPIDFNGVWSGRHGLNLVCRAPIQDRWVHLAKMQGRSGYSLGNVRVELQCVLACPLLFVRSSRDMTSCMGAC